jgi:hypothetical protein
MATLIQVHRKSDGPLLLVDDEIKNAVAAPGGGSLVTLRNGATVLVVEAPSNPIWQWMARF